LDQKNISDQHSLNPTITNLDNEESNSKNLTKQAKRPDATRRKKLFGMVNLSK